MTLTEKWIECSTCDGGGAVSGFPDTPWEQCSDCQGLGLVPPEGMVRAVAERLAEFWHGSDWHRYADWFKAKKVEFQIPAARAVLVAAKRWEKE